MTTSLTHILSIFEKDIYIDNNFKYKFDFDKDVRTLNKIIHKKYKHTDYFPILLAFVDTFNTVDKTFNIQTRNEFLENFTFMIKTFIKKYNSELPVKFNYNQIGTIIEKYLNTNCEICKKYGYYKVSFDETINSNISLCFDCTTYNKCKLCNKKCIYFFDCIKCKKLYCIPCSLHKTQSHNCHKCNTCSICIDVFRNCYC